jgi:hypothetical protein
VYCNVYCSFTCSDIFLKLLFAVNTKIYKNTNFLVKLRKLLSILKVVLTAFKILQNSLNRIFALRFGKNGPKEIRSSATLTTLSINKEGSAARLKLSESDLVGNNNVDSGESIFDNEYFSEYKAKIA